MSSYNCTGGDSHENQDRSTKRSALDKGESLGTPRQASLRRQGMVIVGLGVGEVPEHVKLGGFRRVRDARQGPDGVLDSAGKADERADLIARVASLEGAEPFDNRVVQCAVKAGQFVIVKLLLDNGADTDEEDSAQGLPLALAVPGAQKALASLLIEAGADLNKATGQDKNTMLSPAISNKNESMVRFLIYPGSSTLLALAVAQGNEAIVHLLLEAGVEGQIHTPARPSSNESLPLAAAIEARNVGISRALLQFGADTGMRCGQTEEPD
ncbi:ankyrin repeat-containing domain protein [Lasiosphaeria miniovina]|uniref:Ankyrin repeat-containing domain protein n=1 Tax=Lasiosphaeria miniovina TaxID=1954250 RepID=A0AA40E862_9PEZI|nr:ankyrin repeat-containing domain protein [Lasiosphaeria miniovina]KAK0727566.1 ankyrin repeat-containing domain protein [Lasiosphaeria miniovina]